MALAIVPASLFLGAAGIVIAAVLPLRGATERFSAALLLTLSALTGDVLIAGVLLGRLDPWIVLALAATTLVLALIGARVLRQPIRQRAVAALRGDARRFARFLVGNPGVAALTLVVAVAALWRAVLAVRLPILDFDGLAYHLVTVDVWLQSGQIGRVPQRIWSDAYPANAELVTSWLMLFAHNDGLAKLTGLVGLPLGVAAIAGVARRLGASRVWAAVAGLIVVATPAVILKADSTYVDNLGMAEVAAGLFFGLGAASEHDVGRRRSLLLLTGLAMGLAAGTKASLILPLAGLGLVILLSILQSRARESWRAVGLDALAFLGPILIFGGSWYLKNLLVFGNPLWPFTIGPFAGLGSFEDAGLTPPAELAGLSRLEQIVRSWLADPGYRAYSYDVRIGGFGLAWLPLLGLAIVGAVVVARRRGPAIAGALIVPALLALALMPMPFWPRYTLFFIVLVAVLAAVALTASPPRVGRVAGIAVVLLAVASLAIAHRTANFATKPGGAAHPGVTSLVRLVLANDARRRDIWLWHDCRAFEDLPTGASVRTDGFQLPHLLVGPSLDRRLLVPFTPGLDPQTAITLDGETATHLVLVEGRDIAAARAEAATFEPMGPACRGAEVFRVRTP